LTLYCWLIYLKYIFTTYFRQPNLNFNVSKMINVSGSERDKYIEIVIRDNGVGIHQKIIDKLFKIEHKVRST